MDKKFSTIALILGIFCFSGIYASEYSSTGPVTVPNSDRPHSNPEFFELINQINKLISQENNNVQPSHEIKSRNSENFPLFPSLSNDGGELRPLPNPFQFFFNILQNIFNATSNPLRPLPQIPSVLTNLFPSGTSSSNNHGDQNAGKIFSKLADDRSSENFPFFPPLSNEGGVLRPLPNPFELFFNILQNVFNATSNPLRPFPQLPSVLTNLFPSGTSSSNNHGDQKAAEIYSKLAVLSDALEKYNRNGGKQ